MTVAEAITELQTIAPHVRIVLADGTPVRAIIVIDGDATVLREREHAQT